MYCTALQIHCIVVYCTALQIHCIAVYLYWPTNWLYCGVLYCPTNSLYCSVSVLANKLTVLWVLDQYILLRRRMALWVGMDWLCNVCVEQCRLKYSYCTECNQYSAEQYTAYSTRSKHWHQTAVAGHWTGAAC